MMHKTSPSRPAAVALAVLICACLTYSAASQDAHWFSDHINNKGHYYEGLLDQPNAKQAYEVLGFFAYAGSEKSQLDSHPAPKSVLHAWFYVPKMDQGHPIPDSVMIRAKQIASRTNYLLESMPESIHPQEDAWTDFAWQTDPFIFRYNINPNNLAVLARLKTSDRDRDDIAPVVFSLNCKNEQITHYELMLKIQRFSLADITYEVRTLGGDKSRTGKRTCYFTISEPCLPQRPKGDSPIEVGTVLELPFPVTAPAGWFSLHVFGQYKDSSEGLDLTYTFFHQPDFQCTR